MEFIQDLLQLFSERKKLWTLPLIVLILVLCGMIVATYGAMVVPSGYEHF